MEANEDKPMKMDENDNIIPTENKKQDKMADKGIKGEETRLKSYKYRGRDADVAKKHRDEESVQLRKQKKHELVSNCILLNSLTHC